MGRSRTPGQLTQRRAVGGAQPGGKHGKDTGTEIDRTAVIRVDQAEIPQLIPLVEIRDSRRGDLEQGLEEPASDDDSEEEERADAASAREETQKQLAQVQAELGKAIKTDAVPHLRNTFLAQIRQAVGAKPGVQVADNRLVITNDGLFLAGSTALSPAGRDLLTQIATALKDVTAQQAPDACAGASLELSYTSALGDYNGKKDDLALQEFAQYVKCFQSSANAPNAQYYIGQIYYRNEDWANASQAFDAVVEKFPKNPKTADAAYYKACALMKNRDTKTAAGREFRNFIATYPESAHVKEAHQHLRELGLEGTRAPRKN